MAQQIPNPVRPFGQSGSILLVNPTDRDVKVKSGLTARQLRANSFHPTMREMTGGVGVAPATGATAGIPGTWTPVGATPRANLAGMTGCTASPTTPWTTGQHVQCSDASRVTWSGTSWVGGIAP